MCCGNVFNIGADAASTFETALKTGAPKDRLVAHESASKTRMKAAAVLAASLFFAILGIALIASGVGAGAGVFLLCISLPTLYLSYNTYKTLTNAKEMLDSVNKYRSNNGAIDFAAIRRDLCKGTVLFQWATDSKIDSMNR